MTVPSSTPTSSPIGSLLRKAAVDAGFDLEPEIEGGWWRLRASGAPGVVWVCPLLDGTGTLLALPLVTQLAELDQQPVLDSAPNGGDPALPPGAAGVARYPSPHALHAALRRVWTLRAHAPERLRAQWDADVAVALNELGISATVPSTPATTELIAEVRRRVGQDRFRDALLDYWDGQCAVTGLAVPELLRASHAKPWAVANDAERLNVYNGLLLAVHLDALFDRGLLTFNAAGEGIVSVQLSPESRSLIGVSEPPIRLRHLHSGHERFLAWHRQHVFRS